MTGLDSNAQEILNLQTELAELEAKDSAEALARELMTSIGQVRDALKAISEDAEGATEKLDEAIANTQRVSEALGETSNFINEWKDSLGEVSEGVGKFGEQAAAASDVLDKMKGAMDKVDGLTKLSKAEATVQIRELGNLLGEVKDWLGDLVDFIPGLGAFIEIWTLAIQSIATSAATLESIVLKRNREAREANLPEPYVILKVGSEARADRIAEIHDRLEELGVDLSPPTQSSTGEALPADVHNAIKLGLRDGGLSYSQFLDLKTGLAASRDTINNLTPQIASAEATVFAGPSDVIPPSDVAAAKAKLPGLKEALGEAVEDYESQAAEIQPAADAISGYLHRFASPEVIEKWGPWLGTIYGLSTGLSPDQIDSLLKTAGISSEITIPSDMSDLPEDGQDTDIGDSATATEVAAATTGSSATSSSTKRLIMIGGGGILAIAMVGLFFILPADETVPEQIESPEPVDAVAVAPTPTEAPTEVAVQAEEVEEPLDPCDVSAMGCQDMGTLPDPVEAMYNWTSTRCDETPASESGPATLTPSTNGARLFLRGDGPGSAYLIGDDAVIGIGGGGGSTTTDGVTIAQQSVVDVVSTNDNGFTATVERLEGPVDDDGNFDAANADCTEGGTLDFVLDASDWAEWMALPTSEEPTIDISAFTCTAESTTDGLSLLWAATMQSPIPIGDGEEPSTFGAEIQARLGSWVYVPSPIFGAVGALPDPPGTWRDFRGHLITAMPQSMADELGLSQEEMMEEASGDCTECAEHAEAGETVVIGGYDFSSANGPEEAEALEGFGEDDLIDATVRIVNGVFGASAPSQICPWQ